MTPSFSSPPTFSPPPAPPSIGRSLGLEVPSFRTPVSPAPPSIGQSFGRVTPSFSTPISTPAPSIGRSLGLAAPSFTPSLPSPSNIVHGRIPSPLGPNPSFAQYRSPSPLRLSRQIQSPLGRPPSFSRAFSSWTPTSSASLLSIDRCAADKEIKSENRRSRICSAKTLLQLSETGEGEGNALLLDDCDVADACESLLRKDAQYGRSLEEQREIGVLLDLMRRGAMEPVEITEWSEAAGLDDYYAAIYARNLISKLPPGLICIRDGHFIAGESLAEFVHLYQITSANEMGVMLDRASR